MSKSIEHAVEIDSDLAGVLSDLDYQYQEGLILKSEMIAKSTLAIADYISDNGIQLIAIHKRR